MSAAVLFRILQYRTAGYTTYLTRMHYLISSAVINGVVLSCYWLLRQCQELETGYSMARESRRREAKRNVCNDLRGMFEMNCLFLCGDFKFQVSPKVLIPSKYSPWLEMQSFSRCTLLEGVTVCWSGHSNKVLMHGKSNCMSGLIFLPSKE